MDFGTGTVGICTRRRNFTTQGKEGVSAHDLASRKAGAVVPSLVDGNINAASFADFNREGRKISLAGRATTIERVDGAIAFNIRTRIVADRHADVVVERLGTVAHCHGEVALAGPAGVGRTSVPTNIKNGVRPAKAGEVAPGFGRDALTVVIGTGWINTTGGNIEVGGVGEAHLVGVSTARQGDRSGCNGRNGGCGLDESRLHLMFLLRTFWDRSRDGTSHLTFVDYCILRLTHHFDFQSEKLPTTRKL